MCKKQDRFNNMLSDLSKSSSTRALFIDRTTNPASHLRYKYNHVECNKRFDENNTGLFVVNDNQGFSFETGFHISKALDILDLIPKEVELICFVSTDEFSMYENLELPVLYDASNTGVQCECIVRRKSIRISHKKAAFSHKLIGASLFWSEDIPVPPSAKRVFQEYLRTKASMSAKRNFSKINSMLKDPDYSTTMKDNSFANFTKGIKLLSFDYMTVPFEHYRIQPLPYLNCLPPDNFQDELAEEILAYGQVIEDLLSIWEYYLDTSVINFHFSFNDIESKQEEIWSMAKIIGIQSAVDAYMNGVPIHDLIA